MFPLLMNIHVDKGLRSRRDNPIMPGNKFCSDVDKNLHAVQSYSNARKAIHDDKMQRHSITRFSVQKFNYYLTISILLLQIHMHYLLHKYTYKKYCTFKTVNYYDGQTLNQVAAVQTKYFSSDHSPFHRAKALKMY